MFLLCFIFLLGQLFIHDGYLFCLFVVVFIIFLCVFLFSIFTLQCIYSIFFFSNVLCVMSMGVVIQQLLSFYNSQWNFSFFFIVFLTLPMGVVFISCCSVSRDSHGINLHFMLLMMIISNPNPTSQMYFFYRNNFLMIYATPTTTVRNMNFSEIRMLLQVLKSSQPGQESNQKVLIFRQILGCELFLVFSLLFDTV